MAYEAHKWKIGEEITSEKLNHIEKGIEEAGLPREITDPQDGQTLKYDAASGKWVNGEGGGSAAPLIVNLSTDENTGFMILDKTWQEIYDAFPNVKVHNIETNEVDVMVEIWQPLSGVRILPDSEPKRYSVMGEFGDGELYASSPNDYPNADSGSEDPIG